MIRAAKTQLWTVATSLHQLMTPPEPTSGSQTRPQDHEPRDEPGFEIAQSMGIALLGLVVAAAFATALQALGVDVVARIRTELGL